MGKIIFNPIGTIYSEHTVPQNTPIQPVFAKDCQGKVEIFDEFVEGLKDIEGFSYIYLIYHFHQAEEPKLTLKPFLEDALRGVFATRAPRRPNPIGLSIVKLLKRENNILYFEGADILNQTPLIDIKPYSAKFDVFNPAKNGWQDNINDDDAQIKGRRNYKK